MPGNLDYTRILWEVGDVITKEKLNHIETGLKNLDDLVIIDKENPTTEHPANALWFEPLENKIQLLTTEDFGDLGEFTFEFTEDDQIINTRFILQPNTTYLITSKTKINNNFYLYGINNNEKYKSLNVNSNQCRIINDDVERELIISSVDQYIGTLTIKIALDDSIASKINRGNIEEIYIIDKNNPHESDYTSFIQCLLDLKDNEKQKTIIIKGGNYNIYQEYIDANIPIMPYYDENNIILDPQENYFDYCVWIPRNTHIIGEGTVRLSWMPTIEQLETIGIDSINLSKCVSPINFAGSGIIENIEIHVKNGRYCLNNDGLGFKQFIGAKQRCINVKFYKYRNDDYSYIDTITNETVTGSYGLIPTIGLGINQEQYLIYDNCYFWHEEQDGNNNKGGQAIYGYIRNPIDETLLQEYQSSNINFNNCIINSQGYIPCIKFGNNTNNINLHVQVAFNNTYISGPIYCIDESTTSIRNVFDLTLNHCSDVEIHIDDSENNNLYPPKIYYY